MEIDKLKKWLDIAQQFQSDTFWNQIFEENENSSSGKGVPKSPFSTVKDNQPRCDLYETDQELVVELEVPGLKKEDLQLSIHEQLLTILGEFKSLHLSRKYFLKERMNRKFKKELTLPFPIMVEQVRSSIHNGVLTISLPIDKDQLENIPITLNDVSE